MGIEICNYGPLTLSNDGRFFNYVNSLVPETQVVELDESFRGYKFYHKYTDAQLDNLGKLLIFLSDRFDIDLGVGLQESINKQGLKLPEGLSVLEQQKWLNANNFVGKNGKPLDEDGLWGSNTEWAIQSVGKNPFEYNKQALRGRGGLWTHASVRKDKFDCSPQKNLIDLIQSL